MYSDWRLIALKSMGQKGRGDNGRQQVCFSYSNTEEGSLGNSNSFHKYCEEEWRMKLVGSTRKYSRDDCPLRNPSDV